MINRLLNFIAPHHCFGCQKIGPIMCANCKYDIVIEPFSQCLQCLGPTTDGARCARCTLPYSRAWCVGERRDGLEALIDSYKTGNLKDAPGVLGELLGGILPTFPANLQIVAIPTISRHIRQRGYDHTELMAREIAKQRGGAVTPALLRRTQSVQRGASKARRHKQAKQAFRLNPRMQLVPDHPYLIVDDVYTTGATVTAAAQLLRDAGIRDVWVAVATREPLD